MSLPADGRRARARLAALRRHHGDQADVADDRRILKAAALERRIREAITSPTAPTQADRDRLALLLLRGESA